VLILATSEETVDPLSFLLRIAGYEVLAVGDQSKAVETASAFQPTICLLAQDCDGASSQELAQELRNSFPNGELILAELAGRNEGGETDWNIDLYFTAAENNFQIVEKLEQYLHDMVIVA
jgi:CheY-like chemotaxis protein